MRRTLLASALLLGCNEHETVPGPLVRSTEWVAGSFCEPPRPKVDVLLVIDDSPSMADQAEPLAENLGHFGLVFEDDDAELDYRIAVVSTHVPGPDCAEGRGDGAFVDSSCLTRLGDFVVAANEESDAVDLRSTCKASCEDASIAGPWLEPSNAPDLGAALACRGQVGVSGCTLESPIAAALRALDRAEDANDPAYGFLRPDAGLSIVFIGDEDDCSRPDDATTSLGDSAGCWDAALNGAPTLLGLETFLVRLEAIEDDKQRIAGDEEQHVFVSAVAGVPSGYPDQQPDYEGGQPGDGCVRDGHLASPTVRIRDLVGHYDPFAEALTSVCVENWLPALACLPRGDRGLRPLCIDRGPLALEDHADEACIVTEIHDGETRRLPHCVLDDQSAWVLPEDTDACAVIEEWEGASPSCTDREEAEVRVVRSPGSVVEGVCLEVVCATEL